MGKINRRKTKISLQEWDGPDYIPPKFGTKRWIRNKIRDFKRKIETKLINFLVDDLGMVDNRWIEEHCKYHTRYAREDAWEISNGELIIYLDMWDGALFEFQEEQLVDVNKITIVHTMALDFSKIYLDQLPNDIELSVQGSGEGGVIFGPTQLEKEGIYVITVLSYLVEVREYDELTVFDEDLVIHSKDEKLDDDEKI